MHSLVPFARSLTLHCAFCLCDTVLRYKSYCHHRVNISCSTQSVSSTPQPHGRERASSQRANWSDGTSGGSATRRSTWCIRPDSDPSSLRAGVAGQPAARPVPTMQVPCSRGPVASDNRLQVPRAQATTAVPAAYARTVPTTFTVFKCRGRRQRQPFPPRTHERSRLPSPSSSAEGAGNVSRSRRVRTNAPDYLPRKARDEPSPGAADVRLHAFARSRV